jgi:Mrp family chromosome partitioning ATPase
MLHGFRIYAVVGIKGGVGKSLVAIALAKMYAKFGRVGLVDCDIDSSNIPGMLNIQQRMRPSKDKIHFVPIWVNENLKVVSLECMGLGRKRAAVTKEGKQHQQIIRDIIEMTVWGQTRTLIADMPAGSSDEFLGILDVFDHLDGIIAVAQPSTSEDFARVVDLCKYHGITLLGVVENMNGCLTECGVAPICPACMKEFAPLGKDVIKNICIEKQLDYFGGIPLTSEKIDFDHLPQSISESVNNMLKKIIVGEEVCLIPH